MAMQTGLSMQFPWEPATDTTGIPAELPTLVLHSGIIVFFPIMAICVCVPDSALRKEGADDVCGYSELPVIYWYFQPGQSCGLAAVRVSDWVCPWCHFYTDASALSSTAAASHGLSQKEAQLEVKTPQLFTPQACLEQDPKLNAGGKRTDKGCKLWYVCMEKTKCLSLDSFK